MIETKEEESIALVLTAFGPFGGVEENPSSILLRELPSFLVGSCSWKTKVKNRILNMIVIETSAEGSTEALERLSQELLRETNTKVVCLHLGVNVSGTGYHLEQFAYNDASFRIPDQRGYRPNQTPIFSSFPLGSPCQTNCHVSDLVDHMSDAFPAVESKVSIDPGRFVCNYLYYTSLNKLQNELQAVDASLFLHIPKFDMIPMEIQLEYLAELMRILTRVELD